MAELCFEPTRPGVQQCLGVEPRARSRPSLFSSRVSRIPRTSRCQTMCTTPRSAIPRKLILVLAGAIVLTAAGVSAQDAELTGLLASFPRSMPVSLQRDVALSLPDNAKKALEARRNALNTSPEKVQDFNNRLDRLRADYQRQLDKYAPSRLNVGSVRGDLIMEPSALPTNPFDRGVRAMLDRVVDDNLRTLVNRTLTPEERGMFIDEFLHLDVKKNWSEIQAVRTGKYLEASPKNVHWISPLLQSLGKYIGKKAVDKAVDKAIDAPSELEKANQEKLEQQRLIWIQGLVEELKRDQNRLGKKLDLIGSVTMRSEERLWSIQQGTRAILWTMDELTGAAQELSDKLNHHAEEAKKANKAVLNSLEISRAKIQECVTTGVAQILTDNVRQVSLLQQSRQLTQANAVSLEYLKMASYAGLPTEQKQAWLANNVVQFDSDPAKNLEKVRAEERRLKTLSLSEDIDKYMEGGKKAFAAFERIGKELGMDGKVLETGRQVIEKASLANEAFKAALKGDFFGVAGAIISAIFGGGPDPGELRHQEVMSKLNEIQRGMEAMRKELKEDLRKIQTQVQTLTEITIHQHEQVMAKLQELKGDVEYSFRLTSQVLLSKLARLSQLVRDPETHNNPAITLGDESNSLALLEGLNELSVAVPLPSHDQQGFAVGISLAFLLRTNAKDRKRVEDYLDYVVNPSVELFDRLGDRRFRILTALREPALDHASLKQSLDALGENERELGRFSTHEKEDRNLVLRDFRNFLDPTLALDYCRTVRDLVPMYLRMRQNGERKWVPVEFGRPDGFGDFPSRRKKGVELLKRALYLCDLAIAQGALLGGDVLLPQVYEQIKVEPTEQCGLQLMAPVKDVRQIRAEGKDLIVVADVNNVLHIRIFGRNGNIVLDTDEHKLTKQKGPTELLDDLKRQLDGIWRRKETHEWEKRKVIADITKIVGRVHSPTMKLLNANSILTDIPHISLGFSPNFVGHRLAVIKAPAHSLAGYTVPP
jgi:hypothetical protein